MYLGVHTPKDVLVSMFLTLGISAFIWYKAGPALTDTTHAKKISLGLLCICLFLGIYTFYLYITKTADPEMAKDALKAAEPDWDLQSDTIWNVPIFIFPFPKSANRK